MPQSHELAIAIHGLNKKYKGNNGQEGVYALQDVDLEIPRGSLFGLLGPNGAGKSTLINILAGLVSKTSGSVEICGIDIDANSRAARAAIGVVPQELNMDPFFTPRRLLDLQAGLYGVPGDERRTADILTRLGLMDKADVHARTLSGGMQRRLMVGKAMVHNPPVLVLDEPTAGVDVELRQQLWEQVRELNRAGVTVLLTTHYLEEAERLCDKIAIIHKGRVIASEDKESLMTRLDDKELIVRFREPLSAIPEILIPFHPEQQTPRSLGFPYKRSELDIATLLGAIKDCGLEIADIKTHEADLEDIFLQLTSEKVPENSKQSKAVA